MAEERQERQPAPIIIHLSNVAGYALLLRMALTQDWGDHQGHVEEHVWGELCQALDRLELGEPALHADLASQNARLLDNLRSRLGLS